MLTKAQQGHRNRVNAMLKRAHKFHTSPKEGCIYCDEQFGTSKRNEAMDYSEPQKCMHCMKDEDCYLNKSMCYNCYFSVIAFLNDVCEQFENIAELKEYAQKELDILIENYS